jgi:hypothetical protein
MTHAAGLWSAEFAAGVIDMATGALFAVKLGQLVVALVRQHLQNIQQARLLQEQAEIVTPLVSELAQRMRSREVPVSSKDSVFRAINCVGQALKACASGTAAGGALSAAAAHLDSDIV